MNNFKKQSWASVLLLMIVTLLIYVPFWFRKIKKVTDRITNETLSNNLIITLLITSIAVLIFNINFTLTINNSKTIISTNYFHLGTIIQILSAILVILLSFNLRRILQSNFTIKINSIWTLILGPIYLQHMINKLTEKEEITPSPDIGATRKINEGSVRQIVSYLNSPETQKFSIKQLENHLIKHGHSKDDVKEAIKRSNR